MPGHYPRWLPVTHLRLRCRSCAARVVAVTVGLVPFTRLRCCVVVGYLPRSGATFVVTRYPVDLPILVRCPFYHTFTVGLIYRRCTGPTLLPVPRCRCRLDAFGYGSPVAGMPRCISVTAVVHVALLDVVVRFRYVTLTR